MALTRALPLLLCLAATAAFARPPADGARPAPPATPGAPPAGTPIPATGPAPVAVAPSGSFAPVWLGPLPDRPHADMRAIAAEALPEAGLTGVDDGETLRVAQTGNVTRHHRYADGRLVPAGEVERSRDWVGRVVAAGLVGGKPWIAVRLERKPDRPVDVEVAAPAGAVDEFGALPDPDFAGGSLWMMQKAGVSKSALCDHRDGVDPAIRPHVDAQCSVTWLGSPGSLTDPELVFPSEKNILGFLAWQAGVAIGGLDTDLRALLGAQALWSSRQTGFMSTSRIELAGAVPSSFRYCVDWLIGVQVGTNTTGFAVQGGAGLSGATAREGAALGLGLELPARAQLHTVIAERAVLAWFEPSWVVGGGRAKGSPSLAWADQLRAGLWVSSKDSGLGIRGAGAELWETRGSRVISIVVGLLTPL